MSGSDSYNGVKFGKMVGSLVLGDMDLLFKAGDNNSEPMKYQLQAIAKHQINPKTQPKALLKLVMKDTTNTLLFQMATRQDLEQINSQLRARLQAFPNDERKPDANAATNETKNSSDGKAATAAATATDETSHLEDGSVFHGVQYRTVVGALHLLDNQLKWEGNNDDASKAVIVKYASIAKQQMSPPKIAKYMLKLTKQDDKVVTFQVSNRSELECLNQFVEKRRKKSDVVTTPAIQSAENPASQRTETANDGVYSQVIFKATTGTLTLSAESMTFQSTGSTKASKVIRWSRVTKAQGNPPSHAKALLKVFLTDDSPLLFQIKDRPLLQQLKDDITSRLKTRAEPTNGNKGALGDQLEGLQGTPIKATEDDAVTVETKVTTSPMSTATTNLPIVFEGVKHGNDMGRLVLTKSHISFIKDSDQEATSYSWGEVFKHQISPPKIPKPLMKLVLANEEKPVTFQLPNRAELDKLRRDVAVKLQEYKAPPVEASKLEAIAEVPSNISEIDRSESPPEKFSPEAPEKLLEESTSASKEVDTKKSSLAAATTKTEEATSATPAEASRLEDIADRQSNISHIDQSALAPEQFSPESPEKNSSAPLLEELTSDSKEVDAEKSLLAAATTTTAEEATPATSQGNVLLESIQVEQEKANDDGGQGECGPQETPDKQKSQQTAKQRTKSEVISDLLSLASLGSNGSDGDSGPTKPTYNDIIGGLLSVSNAESKQSSTATSSPESATAEPEPVSSIFDESFASLMSDTGFSMMSDEDSDDDFSVVTTNTAVVSENATNLPVDYKNVAFRSMMGTVTLSSAHLLFQPDETRHPADPATKITWDSVERHHGSPPKHEKAVLKVVLTNGQSITFTMTTRKDLELIRLDLTSRMHEHRKTTTLTSSALEGLVIGKGAGGARSAYGYIPSYKKLPPGAKASTAYHPVHHEQCEGTLFLSWDQLSFQPSGLGDGDKSRTVFWDAVGGHEVLDDRPIMNVKLQDGSSLAFRFAKRREMEKCDKDADSRMTSYDEFESVAQNQQTESHGQAKQRSPNGGKKFKKSPPKYKSPDKDDNTTQSLLDLSGSSTDFDDMNDGDEMFAVPPPPPPPPPPPRGSAPRRGSESSLKSNSSSTSASSNSSSNASSSPSSSGSAASQPSDVSDAEQSDDADEC